MKFEEFSMEMTKELSKELPEVEIKMDSFTRNNGTVLHGLVFHDLSNMAPTIYLDSYYEIYKNGGKFSGLVAEIADLYRKNRAEQSLDISFFTDFTRIRPRIICCAVNYAKNRELLRDVPYVRMFDLAVVFRVVLNTDVTGIATVLVNNKHLALWGQDADSIHRIAEENTLRLSEFSVSRISDILKEVGCDVMEESRESIDMYVVTNQWAMYGANAILYSSIFAELSEQMGADLYILPSSVHELIVIPADEMGDKDEIERVVRDINGAVVVPEEVLADSVYCYNRKEKCITW